MTTERKVKIAMLFVVVGFFLTLMTIGIYSKGRVDGMDLVMEQQQRINAMRVKVESRLEQLKEKLAEISDGTNTQKIATVDANNCIVCCKERTSESWCAKCCEEGK